MKQSSETVEAVERRGQARQAEMLHESGPRTWRRFTTPLLTRVIGVECRRVVGDDGHMISCKVQSKDQACQDDRCECQKVSDTAKRSHDRREERQARLCSMLHSDEEWEMQKR